jgi:hypothetical protein
VERLGVDVFLYKLVEMLKYRCGNGRIEFKVMKRNRKEVDSMDTVAMKHNGYKTINFETLNFSSKEDCENEYREDISPIQWTKEVLTGKKQVVIKKGMKNGVWT